MADGQTVAYQYDVVSFDGMTQAPSSDSIIGDTQFYGPSDPVAKAGLFVPNDPSEDDALGAWGNRWLTWIELVLSEPAPPGATLSIVDVESQALLREIGSYAGQSTVYIDAGYLLPQGSAIRISGGTGRLRYHLTFLSPQDAALTAALVLAARGDSPGPGGADLIFSDDIANADGPWAVQVGEIQRYDAAGATPSALILQLPADPNLNERCAVKEVGNVSTLVTVDGNGNLVESPTAAPAASYTVGIARQSLIFQFDGTAWRLL